MQASCHCCSCLLFCYFFSFFFFFKQKTAYEIQISNPVQDESHCTGSLYSYVPVKNRPDEAANKWHTFEIECRGSVITVKSDDVVCIDKFDQSKDEKTKNKPLKAFIGLQDAHAAAGNT